MQVVLAMLRHCVTMGILPPLPIAVLQVGVMVAYPISGKFPVMVLAGPVLVVRRAALTTRQHLLQVDGIAEGHSLVDKQNTPAV